MNNLFMIIPGLIFSIQTMGFKLYSRKCEQNSGSNAFFSTVMLFITAVTALLLSLGTAPDAHTIFCGVAMGVCFFVFVRLYNEAMACGPMSYTVFIFSLNMLVPIIVSVFLFGEYPSVLNYIGFVVLLVAIFLMNYSGQRSRDMVFSKKWILLCLVGTVFNGGVGLMSKIYPMQSSEPNFMLFLGVAFLVATTLSCILYASKDVRANLSTFKPSIWFVVLVIGIAITNILGNGLYTYFAGNFDAGIYFPTVNGSSMMFSLLISAFIFGEKLRPSAIMGMLFGIFAVMLMSI